MKRIFFVCSFVCIGVFISAQNAALVKSFQKFERDPQLKSSISSLYVVNVKTGKVIFDKNSMIGLAPASTQKIVTAAAAYELLGKDFRYKTEFGLVKTGTETDLYIKPSGDPTLGSSRWDHTKGTKVLTRVIGAYKTNATSISKIFILTNGWNYETIPDGWIWQDIGNYFGAGADVLNWRENQFDLFLRSGNVIGEKVAILETEPRLYSYAVSSMATSAAKGTGDNSYIYFPLTNDTATIRGTIPVGENRFIVSGALPDAKKQFAQTLLDSLKAIRKGPIKSSDVIVTSEQAIQFKKIHTETSPALDSIIYWLNKKSINLYAEALVKTVSYENAKIGSTEKGVELIKEFWKSKRIHPAELNIQDGSGLSPSNRVTSHALVNILLYAKKQSWFGGFYNSLPEYNGMKMKSGTIKDVKGFAGYHTSKAGVEYAFCFLVNNYNGATSTLVQKMYTVLNELK